MKKETHSSIDNILAEIQGVEKQPLQVASTVSIREMTVSDLLGVTGGLPPEASKTTYCQGTADDCGKESIVIVC
jgi:hypothetical protein